MKPIVVPVDFSKAAEGAARYALHVAKAMESNICLCHAFLVPADADGASQLSWPLYEYSALEDASRAQLELLAKKLEIKDAGISSPSSFHPCISTAAVSGPAGHVFKMVLDSEKAGMIIMGLSGAGAFDRLLMGSVSRQTIEHAECPVLLVPSGFIFRKVKKIAFATDLLTEDIAVVHYLASLAEKFGADLVLTHIVDGNQDLIAYQQKSDAFLREVTNRVNYDKIYYRQVNRAGIDEGLNWLAENGHVDVMAMSHHKKSALGRLLSHSHTRKLLGHITVPLLVFPSGKDFTL